MDKNTKSILLDDKLQYEKEQDQLLKTILNLRFFNPWRLKTSYSDARSLQNDTNLEIYISNQCNQNCSYCYLTKYPELYPEECHDSQTIINNLKILYNYIIENNFYIPRIDFFSGEIWHTALGYQVLDLTYEYLQKGLQTGILTIASNGYFTLEDRTFQRMQQYINNFNSIGIPLCISFSIDGKYIDNDVRKRNNGIEYTDEFYDLLFTFAKMNNFGFHPMLDAHVIDKWPENLQWWIDQCSKYKIDFIDKIMFLEVRNNNSWNNETNKKFCALLKTMINYYLKTYCNNKIEILGDALTGISHGQTGLNNYYPWIVNPNDTFLGCSIGQSLIVRLGDLAICPCHRQAYNKYLYGKFIIENNKIIDIKAINPYMAIKILMGNTQTCLHGCASCIFNKYCLKGCLGSQLESYKDPFFPIESVCQFFKTKYTFLMNYYDELGLFKYWAACPIDSINAPIIASLLELKLKLEEAC